MSLNCCDKPNLATRMNPASVEYKHYCTNCHRDLVFMAANDAAMLAKGVKELAMATPDRVLRTVAMGYHRLLKLVAAVCLCLCALSSCYNVGEYKLPDGGLAPHDGDGCSCNDVQTQIVDEDTGQVVVECLPNEKFLCKRSLPDGGACPAATVCFGPKCCTWQEGTL